MFITAKRAGGTAAFILGSLALHEAWKLSAYRTHFLTGDHAFPGIVGILLILFGTALFLERADPVGEAKFPAPGKTRTAIVFCIATLLLYCLLIPWAGYTISTLFAAILLIRIIGRTRLRNAIFAGVLMTAVLYIIFVVLLKTPVPAGLLPNFIN